MISNEEPVHLMSSYTHPTYSYATIVAVVGTMAYMTDARLGLLIIDVSVPSAPSLLSFYDTSGSAFGLAVLGGMAYLTDIELGLQISDMRICELPVQTQVCAN